MHETFERSPSRTDGRLDRLRRAVDDARICEHLRRAESALRSTDHDLPPEKRRRRERHLDRLAAYRERGEFPTNRTEAERVPLFVGDDGTPCAMAHLLLEDGREDLVAAVMAEDPTGSADLSRRYPVCDDLRTAALLAGRRLRLGSRPRGRRDSRVRRLPPR
ncbi:hypothetical protein BRD14_00700 [Halobacteriales archaeon SW_5_68_122]|nr:MAG: hypothetical protein BRD14_00700 [Halobacteriales archaeon SW_5_68_122]